MKAFVVAAEDRPGELARLGQALGEAGVNITALAGLTAEGAGRIGFLVSDEAGARGALHGAGIEARELAVIPIALADAPGALAAAGLRARQETTASASGSRSRGMST